MTGLVTLLIVIWLLQMFFFPKSKFVGKTLAKLWQFFLWVLRVLWQGIIALTKFLVFVIPRIIYWLGCVILEFFTFLFKSLKFLWELMTDS